MLKAWGFNEPKLPGIRVRSASTAPGFLALAGTCRRRYHNRYTFVDRHQC
ncbi:hypothetical protein QUB61_10545 [Microcoleus sp. C2D2]